MSRTTAFGILVLCLCGGEVSAGTRYYVDQGGSDSNAGTDSLLPWKTLGKAGSVKLSPGDSICLHRGSVWTDSLYLNSSGTAQDPVVVTCYGPPSSPAPEVTSPGEVIQVQTGSHIVIEKLFLTGGKWSGVEIADTMSADITLQDLEISHCGGGLYLAGWNIVARRNYIHDGKMVVNTQGAAGTPQANDDYGATGINLGRIDGCSIYGNRLVNLRAPSFDYGYDGGAFEFWRSVRNCEIRDNLSYLVDGFAEFGGLKGDSMVNISFHHNTTFEGGNFLCFHVWDSTGSSTAFGVNYKGVSADNNLEVTRLRDAGFLLLADGPRLADSTLIEIRNNIFVADTLSGGFVYEAGAPHNIASYSHSHNIVWCPKNPFSGSAKPGQGEVWANPSFADSLWDAAAGYDSTLAGFVPRWNSPAAGTGIAVPSDTVDELGKAVPKGSQVDIGPLLAASSSASLGSPRPFGRIPPRNAVALPGPTAPSTGFDALGARDRGAIGGLRIEFSSPSP